MAEREEQRRIRNEKTVRLCEEQIADIDSDISELQAKISKLQADRRVFEKTLRDLTGKAPARLLTTKPPWHERPVTRMGEYLKKHGNQDTLENVKRAMRKQWGFTDEQIMRSLEGTQSKLALSPDGMLRRVKDERGKPLK